MKEGKCADLIMVQKDPLKDLTALRTVDMVMARGRLYEHPVVKRKAVVDEQLDKFL